MNKEELRDWLLGNCVNDNGDLVISDIDLSEFKGKVYLTGWGYIILMATLITYISGKT